MYIIVDLDTETSCGPIFHTSDETILYLDNHPELQNYTIIAI